MTSETVNMLDLVAIVEKASSLAERLSGAFIPANPDDDESAVEARLKQWRQNAARGDQEIFEKRLSWDDLQLEAVRRVLGRVWLADGQPLPAWIHTLDEVLSSLSSSPAPLSSSDPEVPAEDRCLDKAVPIPFQEVWLPFVRLARRNLSTCAGSASQLLSAEALAALERELLRRLAIVGSQALYVEFTAFQALRWPGRMLSFLEPTDRDETTDLPLGKAPTDRYDQFVRYLLDGGLSDFFQDYAVAARLAAAATDQWVEAAAHFLTRLAADLPAIQDRFAANADLGVVVNISAGLSDAHRHGHTVIVLRFASGLKLVYKPRDVGLEAAYGGLLAWLNNQEITPAFKVLNVLDRSSHGWVEFVEQMPCRDEAEASLFYRRAGMLIGLFYILRGSDCHDGNLIACGPHPVVIDLEVLLNPVVAGDVSPHDPDIEQYRNSVLTSGLLPIWERLSDGATHDVGGLAGKGDGQSVRRPEWLQVNTDQMKLVKRKQAIPETSAVPYLNQTALSPTDYLEQIVTGFQEMVRFVQDRQTAMLAPDGPLAAFNHRRARFVFRNTSLYDQIRELSFAPRNLKDGADHSIQLDLVSSALTSSDTKPDFWPMVKEEIRAMEQMDIPLFSIYTDDTAVISDSDEVIVANAFVHDGYHLTAGSLEYVREADVELQSGYIRASMATKFTPGAHRHLPVDQPVPDTGNLPLLTPDQLVEEATALADRLVRSAIRSGKEMAWITLAYTAEPERYELKPVDHSLYGGTLGIALFLGALARVTGDKSYRDQALAALQTLRADLAKGDISRASLAGKQPGLGSAYGIGAVIYGFTRLSQFLELDELAAEARRAATLLTPALIAEDHCPDVFSGSAGAILGLLALYDRSPDQRLLEQALACGRHLLDTRAASPSGYRAWVTLNDALLTGFSHGAAGIAYALARLYEKALDPAFLDAAREATAYERSVFSPEAGNWPDLRFPGSGRPVFTSTWCHGAPGIALARLGSLSVLDSEDIRRDINIALETTRQALGAGGEVDHLCCGTLGRTEPLLKAAQVQSLPDLMAIALGVSSDMARMAKRRGSYRLFAGLPDGIDNPGFFQGASGIGYQWLRLAHPDMFPSVLLWE